MSGPDNSMDVAERDDAHLRSLGIKPELQRTLGFLSNFAVAFSYISVSTGTFTLMYLGMQIGGPSFFWSWPIVILGQTFVALNFAELASHFPVAGSIYQWSKRLTNKTLGWFTGWFYFWAGLLTVTAVAATVPLVLSSIFGFKLDGPSPVPGLNNLIFWGLVSLITSTVINIIGVRVLSLINNIGVAAEILGMAVFAVILLLVGRHQDFSVLTQTAGVEASEPGGYLPVFAVAMFMSLFVVYGFDTAGTFGEETLDASRQAPRGILTAIWASGIIGAIFLLAIILATPDLEASKTDFNPIGTAIIAGLGETWGNVYLFVIPIAVFVGVTAIQGATVRLLFSMGRDGRFPGGKYLGTINGSFKTPAAASVVVGVLAAVPFFITDSPGLLATGATGLIYLSYLMANIGVLGARLKGWPHKQAWFSLGSWGLWVNILALVYGGLMVINFALWKSDMFGAFGTALRDNTNPSLTIIKSGGNPISWLPDIPFFEATVALILVVGAVYYFATGQGRKVDKTEADLATGETVIA